MTTLQCTDVSVTLRGRPVLQNVGMHVAAGEVVGLLGPNAAGKSTLIKAILGFIPHAGSVSWEGIRIAETPLAWRAAQFAYIPQDRQIAWPVSVQNLVALGRLPYRSAFSSLNDVDRSAIDRAIDRMGLRSLAQRPVLELSGGERARAICARALAQETPALIADEPIAGLDLAYQLSLLQIFREMASEGCAVLISIHDLTLAAQWCDRLILLNQGGVVAQGYPSHVLTAGRIGEVYGVSVRIDSVSPDHLSITPLSLLEKKGVAASSDISP